MSSLGNVLLIDDEANIRVTLTRILQKAGCNVTHASSGSEALQLISGNLFDLVYLDLRLPDINGIDMLREIRRTNQLLPVIVLTGYGSISSAVEALHLEATDYLLKPIDPGVLVDRTTSILRRIKVDRRKKEIHEQIAQLQAELATLESEIELPAQQTSQGISKTSLDSRFIKAGPFTLDLQTRRINLNSEAIDIPPASFDYFVVLARHAPGVVRYQDLVSEAQGFSAEYAEAQSLTRYHIHILRQSIEADPKFPKFILNSRGIGYQLSID